MGSPGMGSVRCTRVSVKRSVLQQLSGVRTLFVVLWARFQTITLVLRDWGENARISPEREVGRHFP